MSQPGRPFSDKNDLFYTLGSADEDLHHCDECFTMTVELLSIEQASFVMDCD